MQIQVMLRAAGELKIPLSYNHQLQSAIYAKLREVGESDFWHECGFSFTKVYKAFVFGPLKGSYSIEGKHICFKRGVSFEVRSPLPEFCDAVQRSLELQPQITLFDTCLDVVEVKLSNQHINGCSATFTAESPIIAYSTDKDRYTHFYGPEDECFVRMLERNYKRKYIALFDQEPDDIAIVPIGEHRRIVTKFKDTWLTGWKGKYQITGSSRTLEFIYNAGLGSKNTQGFGLLKAETL